VNKVAWEHCSSKFHNFDGIIITFSNYFKTKARYLETFLEILNIIEKLIFVYFKEKWNATRRLLLPNTLVNIDKFGLCNLHNFLT